MQKLSGDQAEAAGRSKQLRLVLALGTAQTLAWASSYYLPAILATPIARDLGLSRAAVFGAVSVALLIAGLCGPMAGRWIDRRGGRGMLCLSNLVFAAGLVLLGCAQGGASLFAAWAIIGLAMSIGLYETAFATLATNFGTAARGPITGIALLAGFASTLGWPLTTLLEAQSGWRGACFAWAGLHLTLGLGLNALFVPAGSKFALHGEAQGAPDEISAPPQREWVAMALLAFVFAATWFVSTSMAAHLPRMLEMAGASAGAALFAAMMVGPAQVLARIAEFSLMARLHPLTSARLAALGHPLGALALALAGSPMALVFAGLHGAGNGVLTIAKGTLPLAIFGPFGYGLRQGWLNAPARILQALAPLLFGLMLDDWGVAAIYATAALSLASFAALAALRARRD